MEQKNLKAYLDLVQKLLNCRRGEEWIVLRHNEQLVDAKFIEVMEQVANYLATEGELNGARYLHNWAGKLHHILTQQPEVQAKPDATTQAYAQLIEALLKCPQGEEQRLLEANQSLVTPDLVKFMGEVAHQFERQGDRQTATYLGDLATAVNRTWIQTHDFQPNLQKANQLAPDPWEDASEAQADSEVSQSVESPEGPAPEPVSEVASAPQAETSEDSIFSLGQAVQDLSVQVQAIAQSLARLETAVTASLKPNNPLAYLEILEKAAAAGWMITSEEVEQLIGVKPVTARGQDIFERGNWRFLKAGKIGAQTGWHVEKIH
ncbi:hypothetical protein NIES970_00270 [[Synechococcus] sp. NIES-970]|nr:hypothetical protein NIES970_00270 [[Synechococcus] sp. NIES-970]